MARIVVGMSGGVDSSVAAALLCEAGHEVIGVFLRNGRAAPPVPGERPRCCGAADASDARRVAARLGAPFYALDHADDFDQLIGDFADAYAEGRTPNPCVACNRDVKFAALLAVADAVGAARIATGHYARLATDPQGTCRVRRAADPAKDQSYFLAGLTGAQIRRADFPLGDLTKPVVRAHARRLGLATAEKPESQELCFVAGRSYLDVVQERRPDAVRRGEVVDREGRVLGTHAGLAGFTVGQRRGLGRASGPARHVVALDPARNRIVVGPREALARDAIAVGGLRWVGPAPADGARLVVQLRHRHTAVPAVVASGADGSATVHFEDPVVGAAPGQVAAFYDGDVLVGAGTILAESPDDALTVPNGHDALATGGPTDTTR